MELDQLTAAAFAPHRGTLFKIAGGDATDLDLRLDDVEALPAQPNAPRSEPFVLVFTGPAQPRLDQGIHRLSHRALGELEIFLVPIGYGADGGLLYEAVFN